MKARKQDLETIVSLAVHLKGCMDFIYKAELEQEITIAEPVRALIVDSTISLQKAKLVLIEHGVDTTDILKGRYHGS